MPLPTGTITMSEIHQEVGGGATAQCSLNDTDIRSLAGKSSGIISMDDLRGKSAVPSITSIGLAYRGRYNYNRASKFDLHFSVDTLPSSVTGLEAYVRAEWRNNGSPSATSACGTTQGHNQNGKWMMQTMDANVEFSTYYVQSSCDNMTNTTTQGPFVVHKTSWAGNSLYIDGGKIKLNWGVYNMVKGSHNGKGANCSMYYNYNGNTEPGPLFGNGTLYLSAYLKSGSTSTTTVSTSLNYTTSMFYPY